ncbi:MAG: AraC family transcriptional regulator [Mobilitalea sp.]
MEVNVHNIVDYYARANISFAGIFVERRTRNDQKVISRRTNPRCAGIAVLLTGNICISLNGEAYLMQPGMVVHAGPDMQIKIESMGDIAWQLAVIHYMIPKEERADCSLFEQHFPIQVIENVKVSDFIHQLLQIQSAPGSYEKFKAKCLFINFIGELLSSMKTYLATDNSAFLDQIMEYIRCNYSEDLSVVQIADSFKLDRRRLAGLFKTHVGMTPSNYLIECRILKAKELLRSCECPINQVAECVGYSDSLYFSKLFKKRIGHSPSEYRECVKNNM